MANPTMVYDTTTLTFRPGCIQVVENRDEARQRRLLSTNGDVAVREVSTVDEAYMQIRLQQLPREDEGSFSGWDSLLAFLTETVNFGQQIITFTDADSDAFSVRLWQPDVEVEEVKKDVFEGTLLFRVETE